jgi:adenylate/nucleoside-diphosphate kinase
VKVDNPDDVRTTADLDEEARRLPKGDFGDYCPVTYVKDKWLMLGGQEQEVTIFGKTYWLSGEKEAEEFKFNPNKFLVTKYGSATLPL